MFADDLEHDVGCAGNEAVLDAGRHHDDVARLAPAALVAHGHQRISVEHPDDLITAVLVHRRPLAGRDAADDQQQAVQPLLPTRDGHETGAPGR